MLTKVQTWSCGLHFTIFNTFSLYVTWMVFDLRVILSGLYRHLNNPILLFTFHILIVQVRTLLYTVFILLVFCLYKFLFLRHHGTTIPLPNPQNLVPFSMISQNLLLSSIWTLSQCITNAYTCLPSKTCFLRARISLNSNFVFPIPGT